MEVREPSAKYLARSAYKQTDVGVIPEDWQVAKLREISPKQSVGLVINPSSYFDKGGSVPMLVGSNIGPNKIDWESANRISEESNRQISASRLSAGDLVTVRVGEPGVTAVVPHELDGCNCASVMIVRKGKTFDSHWLCYVMNSPTGISQIENVQYGTAQKQFNISDAVNFVYPFPPLPEQQAIAEALSDADALIDALEQLLAKKRQIKQGAMQELLTGQKRLPGFAGEWHTKPMGALFDFGGGFTASRDQLGTEGHCYLHYGDIHTSNKTYVDVRSEFQEIPKLDVPLKKIGNASLLENGDVVFVDASEDDEGTSKHVVVVKPDGVPFISGLHTIVAKSKTTELDDLYKRYCFQTPSVKAQFRFFAVGTKVSGISKTNIGKITIAVPPVEEQTAIAALLSDMDAELAALEAKLAKARDLKQGMMQELLTGRIRLV
jgi:type I restriction enzyme S subunit